MDVLLVIDAQNEFSAKGKRPLTGHEEALQAIKKIVALYRQSGKPIAWIRHHNLPHESPAFIPGSWGAEFSPGMGPLENSPIEKEFQKNVYGAFTGTNIKDWLQHLKPKGILIVGYFTHGCVSTTAREAIMAQYDVSLDTEATASWDIQHHLLGFLPAAETKRSALLQLASMGAALVKH
ncbi:MAG TPA: isochorismatase family cysteine hydrolase [Chitinophagaceae bacterium]|jgi:nicotinamidase-related amidase|nr:isochorismatase family cysteine hydrolase [Chitinophagaceae bacterium]